MLSPASFTKKLHDPLGSIDFTEGDRKKPQAHHEHARRDQTDESASSGLIERC
jgi:hypothetical protein